MTVPPVKSMDMTVRGLVLQRMAKMMIVMTMMATEIGATMRPLAMKSMLVGLVMRRFMP